MKPKRRVQIVLRNGTWFVLYLGRRKHQHYSAAQFWAKDHSEQQVKDWVTKQPALELTQ